MTDIDFMGDETDVKEAVKEHKGVDVYMNISNVKLHTANGIVWPRQEVILTREQAKPWGDKLISRTIKP